MRVFEIKTMNTRQVIAAKTISAALELFDRKYDLPGYGVSITELPMTAELQRRVDDYLMFRKCGIYGCGRDEDYPFFIDAD
jgi:GTP-binding protein EngB required for normal cell division